MSNEFFLMLAFISAASAVFFSFLAFTEAGRKLNSTPAILPFLTVIGCLLLPIGTLIVGSVNALQLFIMLAGIGMPFVIRGIWLVASDYVDALSIERRAQIMEEYERRSK